MDTHRDRTTVCIPSVVLHGSRLEKLLQLDDHVSRLHAIRRTFMNGDVAPVAYAHARSHDASSTRWLFAGAAIVLVLALLALGGWVMCSGGSVAASPAAAGVRATR
jgi:hypothetical protein